MIEYRLNNDNYIPAIGIGTWQITNKDILYNVINHAIKIGYMMIDTASAYGNELAIGRFIKDNQCYREKLFLVDKVWNTERGYNQVKEACKKSLKKLKTDYLDAYLIHWPASKKMYENWYEINSETWRGMEELYKEGLVKNVGVCNFKKHHIDELKKTLSIMPSINQIEFHPGLVDDTTIGYCRLNGIHIVASSPLGNGKILDNRMLNDIARKYNKTVSQIVLAWLLDKKVTVIPKTINIDRLKENMDAFSIELENEDIKNIDSLKYIGGLNIDPDEVTEFG